MGEKPPPLVLDASFYLDLKVEALEEAHGDSGTAKLVKLWGLLWENGRRLHVRLIPLLAKRLKCSETDLQSLLATATAVQLLEIQDGYIFSRGLCERWAEWEQKRDAARERWGKRPLKAQDAQPPMQPHHATASCGAADAGCDLILNGSEDETEAEAEKEPEPPQQPPPTDEYQALALESLLPEDADSISDGRRRMRDYPDIRLTPGELADVARFYDREIPRERWGEAFRDCASRLRSLKGGGKSTRFKNCYPWLTTFIYQALLDNIRKENYAKNSESVRNGNHQRR